MLIELIVISILFLILLMVSISKIPQKKSSVFLTMLIGILFGGSVIYLWGWYLFF